MTVGLAERAREATRAFHRLERTTRDTERQSWFRWLARAGLAARGVVYLLLCVILADIAWHGSAPAPASGEGAMAAVAGRPGGPGLLVALAAGLAAYGGWRAVQALTGNENPREVRGPFVRLGWLAIAGVYVALCVRAVRLVAGSGGTSGNGKAHAWAATVLGWPGGQVWLGIGGTALVVGGVALGVWGLAHDYDDQMRLKEVPRALALAVKATSMSGDIARGALAVLVGGYLLDAAVEADPSTVKTVDQALRVLAHQPLGALAVAALAAGLLCYGISSLAEAWLRDL